MASESSFSPRPPPFTASPPVNPIFEEAPAAPINPYGRSKLMVEWMLDDAARAHGLSYVALRYFNVAGADPKGRLGQSSHNATHLIKVCSASCAWRASGPRYFRHGLSDPDGTCVRDYIHVTDLIGAHLLALKHLRAGGESLVLNCGYGHGYSVREVVDVVKNVSGVDFETRIITAPPWRSGRACRGRGSHSGEAWVDTAIRRSQ